MSRLLTALVLTAALCAPAVASAVVSTNVADLHAGTYALDKKHSSVIARVSHMGVNLYTARFDSLDASFTYDPAHLEAAKVQATVDATSADVGADYSRKFADEFLDATKYPTITFVSTELQRGAGNAGTMTGNLTLRGVTKPVTFDVAFDGVGPGLLVGTVAGFSATTTFKRSDFGSTFLQNVVGDEVTVQIEAEFDKK